MIQIDTRYINGYLFKNKDKVEELIINESG